MFFSTYWISFYELDFFNIWFQTVVWSLSFLSKWGASQFFWNLNWSLLKNTLPLNLATFLCKGDTKLYVPKLEFGWFRYREWRYCSSINIYWSAMHHCLCNQNFFFKKQQAQQNLRFPNSKPQKPQKWEVF